MICCSRHTAETYEFASGSAGSIPHPDEESSSTLEYPLLPSPKFGVARKYRSKLAKCAASLRGWGARNQS